MESSPTKPRALFFGTPQFAVPYLDALHGFAEVVRVISQPDRPAGRGMSEQMPPVKARALELGIPTMQPTKLKPVELHRELAALDVEFALVVAYGRILPKGILEAPRRGCVNAHGSLLPRWRGAAPIQWSVIAGDAETGVCLMEMDEGLDTGPVFATARTRILESETSGELFERLSFLGAELAREKLPEWLGGHCPARAQDESAATHARMLTKDDGWLDFRGSAVEVHNRARGTNPWPGAQAMLLEGDRKPTRVKIHRTAVVARDGAHGEPGRIVGDELVVACGRGAVALLELQFEGKKRLSAKELSTGRKFEGGARFQLTNDEVPI